MEWQEKKNRIDKIPTLHNGAFFTKAPTLLTLTLTLTQTLTLTLTLTLIRFPEVVTCPQFTLSNINFFPSKIKGFPSNYRMFGSHPTFCVGFRRYG